MNKKSDYSALTSKYAQRLAAGEVGVIPTDTIYGIVASAASKAAVERIYAYKSREAKPGTMLAASIDQLVELGIKRRYLTAVEQFWPGAVSVVVPVETGLDYIHQGKYSLAVRIPDNEQLREFLTLSGPLVTSSANLPGQPPAHTVDEARQYFSGDVDFYIDGGDMGAALPSTIIRMVDDAVEVLRLGSVTIDEATGRISAHSK